jgi:DNA-binding CsgD family transcriptional regulator
MPYAPEGWTPLPPQSRIVRCFDISEDLPPPVVKKPPLHRRVYSKEWGEQRRAQIAKYLDQGMGYSEISRIMDCHHATVMFHARKIRGQA